MNKDQPKTIRQAHGKTQSKIEEKVMDDVICFMEDIADSIIGEDGLTVWDFAELRDAFIKYHLQQQNDLIERVIELIGEDEKETYDQICTCEKEYLYGKEVVNACVIHTEPKEPQEKPIAIAKNKLRHDLKTKISQMGEEIE